ncbi:MAG: hypothetical protein V5B40_18125 [Candidatus Accumulibacter meliphilus]|jgi:hypothetical protein
MKLVTACGAMISGKLIGDGEGHLELLSWTKKMPDHCEMGELAG